MAEQDASLRERQPWKAAHEQDYAWLGDAITKHYAGDDSDVQVLMGGILQAFAGWTVDEYEAAADVFLARRRTHPTLARPLRAAATCPMVELLRYLEANGFTNYIASGGDRDFMRPITQEMYGIPPERVIGSSNGLRYEEDEHGGTVVYLARAGLLRRRPGEAGAHLEPDRPPPVLAVATPTATSRCSSSPAARRVRRCACSSSTTTPSASSTTPAGAETRAGAGREAGLDGRQHQERLAQVFADT